MFNRTARAAQRVFSVAGFGLLGLMPLSAFAMGDALHGQQLYQTHCAGCHGVDGVSTMPQAPHLARPEIFTQTDQQLTESIRNGGNTMPPFFGILRGNDFADVISYLRTFH
jgi:mono/diheme cytochrome c family protein